MRYLVDEGGVERTIRRTRTGGALGFGIQYLSNVVGSAKGRYFCFVCWLCLCVCVWVVGNLDVGCAGLLL